MIDRAIGLLVTIVGLASLAVVVSKKSNTDRVATSLLSGLSGLIESAVSPVTGK